MNDINDIFQVDYLPEKREIRINLPEEVWRNIDSIIMTRLFQEELVVEKQKKARLNYMEYKFKAWVKPVIEDGEVVYTGCIVDVWGIDFKRRKIIYYEPFDLLPMIGTKEELSFDEIELLPYIGLNDINGKEIYKGDILKFTHEREDFKNENAKIVVEIPKIYSVMSNPYNHSFEIIGSVYTNPELLERYI